MSLAGITLLGLGPGDPALLTRQAWETLMDLEEIYLRTKQHPTVAGLPAGLRLNSFDYLYEDGESYASVYDQIVEQVLELGRRPQGVVYAVPGHPFVAEATSPEIARQAREIGIPVRLIEGISFLEATFTALQIDPFPQMALIDALVLVSRHYQPFPPSMPAVIAQIHSPAIASEVKLTLMAAYPDEHLVQMVHRAGQVDVLVETLPLYEIDRSTQTGLLTALYVPALGERTSFEAFQEIIAHLRAPDGCPWDREQTHQTLRSHLLEEAYEVLAALDAEDSVSLREELGDLLLQIVLHAQIASEYGEFTMADVLEGIQNKLIRRHPHVFGDLKITEPRRVIENWERLKAAERDAYGKENQSILEGVPLALPALAQAEAYQKRAARVGFDWPNLHGVLEKIEEELQEIHAAGNETERAWELGDLLFAVVNLARWLDVDAESALRQANARFRERFISIENAVRSQGREQTTLTLDEMDALWEEAKDNET